MISTIQIGLTPGFLDKHYDSLYESLKKVLINNSSLWLNNANKHKDFKLTFYLVTKKGNENLRIKGPSISYKMKLVDFSIFLPDEIKDFNNYVDLVFEGIGQVLTKYNVSESEIEDMKVECKKELKL